MGLLGAPHKPTPCCCVSASRVCASFRSVAMGFSHQTCLPASRALRLKGACKAWASDSPAAQNPAHRASGRYPETRAQCYRLERAFELAQPEDRRRLPVPLQNSAVSGKIVLRDLATADNGRTHFSHLLLPFFVFFIILGKEREVNAE